VGPLTRADVAPRHRPEISRKSAERISRSAVEMSRGDMLKKETNQRLLKLRLEKERFTDFTFK
jgi:hypothetical protein